MIRTTALSETKVGDGFYDPYDGVGTWVVAVKTSFGIRAYPKDDPHALTSFWGGRVVEMVDQFPNEVKA